MRVSVEFELPSGEHIVLGHGGLIGRLWSADLHLNDARISEAHAMVSLRGRDVCLLALRGRFAVKGKTLSSVVLRPGLRVVLATGLSLDVVEVWVPESVLALEAEGVGRQVLAGVSSLFGGARPRIVSGWKAAADDYLWHNGEVWMRSSSSSIPVEVGDSWQVAGVRFTAAAQRLEGTHATVREVHYHQPIQLTARFDTVHLMRAGEPALVISGHMARVISELVVARTALGWEDLARQLWGDVNRDTLRRRWDMQLLRLRVKLRDRGIRQDLLHADGTGLVELLLGPADVLIDET